MKINDERLPSMESDIRHIKTDVSDIKKMFAACEKKYSRKWVENFIIAVIILSFGAFITQL